MKNAEEIRAYIRKALEPVNNNRRYGAQLEHDPQFARFWEGRMVEVRHHKENLENIMKMLGED